MPRLADFQLSHPGVVIELETNHRGVDAAQRDFDIWIAYVGETAAPRPQGLFEGDAVRGRSTSGLQSGPYRSACAVLSHHDSRLQAQSGSPGIPGMDTERGLNRRPGTGRWASFQA